MRILFLSHRFYPDIGGIEVNAEILASAFQAAGHEVRLVTWSREKGNKRFPFEVTRSPGVWRLMRRHWWADVVYENNPCLRLSWPALLFRKPDVIAIRAALTGENTNAKLMAKVKLKWLERARSVIAVSDAMRRTWWPAAKVIGNPYRADLFRNNNLTRDREFVFVGRLVSDKGAELAIRAFSALLQQSVTNEHRRSCNLTIAGDGPEMHALTSLARALGVSDNVSFVGVLKGEGLALCLNQHRYLLVPSLCEEGFGNVVLEGLACGCIPIASDGGGLPEAVGKAGLLFPKGDVAALTECMRLVTEDKELVSSLVNARSAHLREHYPEVVARKYLDVITTAVL